MTLQTVSTDRLVLITSTRCSMSNHDEAYGILYVASRLFVECRVLVNGTSKSVFGNLNLTVERVAREGAVERVAREGAIVTSHVKLI